MKEQELLMLRRRVAFLVDENRQLKDRLVKADAINAFASAKVTVFSGADALVQVGDNKDVRILQLLARLQELERELEDTQQELAAADKACAALERLSRGVGERGSGGERELFLPSSPTPLLLIGEVDSATGKVTFYDTVDIAA